MTTEQIIGLTCIAVFMTVSLTMASATRVAFAAVAALTMAAGITALAVILNLYLVMPI